jgi:hypothetical protein
MCLPGTMERFTVHLGKGPCCQRVCGGMGDIVGDRMLLAHKRGADMFIALPDPAAPALDLFLPFMGFLGFAEHKLHFRRELVIHCESGFSTAPTLALVLLAARGEIANRDFAAARDDFLWMYPAYLPGDALVDYVHSNWRLLLHLYHASHHENAFSPERQQELMEWMERIKARYRPTPLRR